MAEITRINISTKTLEEAMGLPPGAKIARVDMDHEGSAVYIWVAYEGKATCEISACKLSDLGKGFLPEDQIPSEIKTSAKGSTSYNTQEVRGEVLKQRVRVIEDDIFVARYTFSRRPSGQVSVVMASGSKTFGSLVVYQGGPLSHRFKDTGISVTIEAGELVVRTLLKDEADLLLAAKFTANYEYQILAPDEL